MNKRSTTTLFLLAFGLMPSMACALPSINSYHLMQSIGELATIISTVAVIMGIALVFAAIFKFKRYGEMRTMMSSQMTISQPLMMMLAGVVLLALPVAIKVFLNAFWSTSSPLNYVPLTNTDSVLIPPVLMFVRLIGVISFIRGWVMMSKSGPNAPPGNFAKAVIHIISGVLAMHILGVVHVLKGIFSIT